MSHTYRFMLTNQEEIGHVLQSAWGANLWNNFQRSNNTNRAPGGLSWYDVAPSFDSLRKILDTFPPQEKTQVFAVVVGHVVSPAACGGISRNPLPVL